MTSHFSNASPRATALLAAALFVAAASSATTAQAQQDLSLECIVEPEMTVELASAIDGVVREVNVDKSDDIKEGQILAKLESSMEEAAVALARSRASMTEEIEAKRIQLGLADRKKERVLALFSKKSVPGFEKDEAIANAGLAQLELNRARSNQKLAKLELNRAKADLELRSLRSPIDGIVMDRFVHPGESIKDRPLLKIAKIDPMRVEIIAGSELFGQIKEGMPAEIIIEGPQETSHKATVALVDSLVDAASGTFGIRLKLPNPEHNIVGGLKCKALFKLSPAPINTSNAL